MGCLLVEVISHCLGKMEIIRTLTLFALIARAKAGFAEFLRRNLPVNPLKCEYYLPSVVTAALEAEAADVQVLTSRDKWYGITYREDKPDLVAALRKMSADGLYPADRLF